MTSPENMSRRERQIMDIIFQLGKATAQEVLDNLSDPPSYSAVRALLNTMEKKGLLKHSKESRKYVYEPVVAEQKARKNAINHLLETFFEGKPEKLVASLLDPKDEVLDKQEIAEIRKMIK